MPARPCQSRERGAALLIVTVAIAVLTALAVDLAYQARVSLQTSADARDELRAECLAKSGVNMSRLVLVFQQQVDKMTGAAPAQPQQTQPTQNAQNPQAATVPAGAAQPLPTALASLMSNMPRIRIWSAVPVSSAITDALFGEASPAASAPADLSPAGIASRYGARGGAPGPGPSPSPSPGAGTGSKASTAPGSSTSSTAATAASAAAAPPGAGPGADGFEAKIEDESRKVNVQMDQSATSGVLGAQVGAYFALVGDHKWDFLFDREDENGFKASRDDVVIFLHDWTDETVGAGASVLNRANLARPIEKGFGDKNFPYERGPDRYKTKNHRFDSLDEVHLVAGVSDAFIAAFGDQLTVYTSKDATLDVNTTKLDELIRNATLMAMPGQELFLQDPNFRKQLVDQMFQLTRGGWIAITQTQFAQLLTALGLKVNSVYSPQTGSTTGGAFGSGGQVFHIRSTASAGGVTRTVDAVVTFDPNQLGGVQADLGQILHWRTE
jgi:general secretion pathway protein K